MLKNLYAVAAFVALASHAQAQFINVTDSENQVVNGQLVTWIGQADTALIIAHLNATNTGSTAINVNMKRYEIGVLPGTQNYFCWGVCYDAAPAGSMPFWAAGQEGMLSMAPGETLNNFGAYYVPMGIAGQSTFRFVWYNTAAPTDTVYVDVRFDLAAVGIEETNASAARIEAYPNPAIGQDAVVDLSMDRAASGTQLIVHDMLGATVKQMAIGAQQARVTLPTTEWLPGVYSISIQRHGALLATRRLVVAR